MMFNKWIFSSKKSITRSVLASVFAEVTKNTFLAIAVAGLFSIGHLSAQETSGISNEIEQIKKEVLELNRELFILEEDLLFPASTKVAVFVSVNIGRFFTLDSVELKLNDKEVAGFLYTTRQRESLEQGGIQELFKGNVKAGEHELTAIFIGKDNENRQVKRAVSYTFNKDDEAIMIELKLEDKTQKFQTDVSVEEWVL